MKGCIKVLKDQPPTSVEGLLNALRWVDVYEFVHISMFRKTCKETASKCEEDKEYDCKSSY